MHLDPFRSRETVMVFKRGLRELCKQAVCFSNDMDFAEVVHIINLKSAFRFCERPFHFYLFHQCCFMLVLLMLLSYYVLSIKRQSQKTTTSLKKWATVGECAHFSTKKGVLSCCWVSTTRELGTTRAETHVTRYLFLAL